PATCTQSTSSAAPLGTRPAGTDHPEAIDKPYRHGGGDPHPIVAHRTTAYPAFGAFGTMNPHINSPRVQNWNVTVQRQLGTDWGVAVSYLGNYSDRLWSQTAINPGLFMGLGACTLRDGRFYPVCSTKIGRAS